MILGLLFAKEGKKKPQPSDDYIVGMAGQNWFGTENWRLGYTSPSPDKVSAFCGKMLKK